MPKKIDSALRDRAVRLVREHRSEYPSLTAASAAVARQVGVGHESVRRWVLQADIDDGTRGGVTSVENAEIKKLKAENTRLREDGAILVVGIHGATRPRRHRAVDRKRRRCLRLSVCLCRGHDGLGSPGRDGLSAKRCGCSAEPAGL